MKVILSRKGFDSVSGGMMSPIMPNGDLLSMPIPVGGDPMSFRGLKYGSRTFRDLLLDLNPTFNFGDCHLDPDIDPKRHVKLPCKWGAAFGQNNAASSYLLNTVGVESGDIFLFFGNFHAVELKGGGFRFIRRTGKFHEDHDLHVIWGYLQVGEILTDPEEIARRFPWHPHAMPRRLGSSQNVLFLPRKRLSLATGKAGCGLLKFRGDRVLTLEGCVRSVWKRNRAYGIGNVIGNRHDSAPDVADGIRYGGQWQELALRDTKLSADFARSVIL